MIDDFGKAPTAYGRIAAGSVSETGRLIERILQNGHFRTHAVRMYRHGSPHRTHAFRIWLRSPELVGTTVFTW